MEVVLKFDTEQIFSSRVRAAFEKYFRCVLTAGEAARSIGLQKPGWDANLANLFFVAVDPHNPAAELRVDGASVSMKKETDYCTQCGHKYTDAACGPTHAMIAAERRKA